MAAQVAAAQVAAAAPGVAAPAPAPDPPTVTAERPKTPAQAAVEGAIAASILAVTCDALPAPPSPEVAAAEDVPVLVQDLAPAERPTIPAEEVIEGVIAASVLAVTSE